jgi:hypothetical protein
MAGQTAALREADHDRRNKVPDLFKLLRHHLLTVGQWPTEPFRSGRGGPVEGHDPPTPLEGGSASINHHVRTLGATMECDQGRSHITLRRFVDRGPRDIHFAASTLHARIHKPLPLGMRSQVLQVRILEHSLTPPGALIHSPRELSTGVIGPTQPAQQANPPEGQVELLVVALAP